MRIPRWFSLLKLPALALIPLVIHMACHLTGDPGTEEVFTFPTLMNTLEGSDTALIILKGTDGNIIDTLYHGPVNSAAFANLSAPHYKGGKVVVSIEGFKDGATVSKAEKIYSGTSGLVDSTIVIISRPAVTRGKVDSVQIFPDSLTLVSRGATGDLRAIVYPETASQRVTWKSLESTRALVTEQGRVSGLDSGMARIVAVAVADSGSADTVWVRVLPPRKVEKVAFDRALLNLYMEGSVESLQVSVLPAGSNPEVRFTVADTTVAGIQGGKVKGLRAGETQVTAKSIEDTSIYASIHIVVHPRPADPVDSVSVSPDTLKLFTNGESLRLMAAIHPKTQQESFVWQSASGLVATVDATGNVTPVAPGRTFVRARSLVDSTKGDSSVVIVRKDVPRIDVGADTTISVGKSITYNPQVRQDYGLTILVRWDLDGNGSWDDSATAFRPVTQHYGEAKEYYARFYAKDSEGNDTTVIKKVKAVSGPVILFISPVDETYTNLNPITVTWSVDGAQQSSQGILKGGPNTVTRSAQNGVGETFSAAITVHYDSDPPARPAVKGPSGPISTLRPSWTWVPSGDGNGIFRFRLDSDNLGTGATVVADTSFTPAFNLPVGPHILYVQERDKAGNWSASGSFTVRIDTTPPPAPAVSVAPASPSNNRRPIWTWTGTAAEGTTAYRYKLDNGDLRTGAIDIGATAFTPDPGAELLEGPHTLFVQQRDSAGNWSASGSATIVIDLTPPLPPSVNASASPTNDRTPSWNFTPRGGGNGIFRYKLNNRNFAAGATEIATPGYTPSLDLAAGIYTLHVQERDTAGNWSQSDSASITIDLSGPAAPQVTSARSSVNVPSWAWIGTGRAGARFTILLTKVGEAGTKDSLTQTFLSYQPRPSVSLSSGTWKLQVREEDNLGNWGPYGESDVEMTKPGKPSFNLAQTSGRDHGSLNLQWTWNAATNGGGGYELSMNGGAPFTVGTLQYSQVGTEGQSYTLSLRALDGAGIKGDTVLCHPVKVDVTPPTFAFTTSMQSQIVSGNPVIAGTASDPGGGSGLASVTYSAPGATPASGSASLDGGVWTLNSVSFPVGFTTVSFSVTDKAGLKSSRDFTLIKNVVFVKTGNTNGTGLTWESAYGSIESALDASKMAGYPAGTQVWMTEGEYLRSSSVSMIYLKSGLEIYGGFSNFNSESRTLARDLVSNRTTIKSDGPELLAIRNPDASGITNVKIDGVNFNCESCIYGMEITASTNIEFANCGFTMQGGEYLVSVYNSEAKFTDCEFSNSMNILEVLGIKGAEGVSRRKTTLTRCRFDFNTAEATLFVNNANADFQSCTLSQNTPWGGSTNYTFGLGDIAFNSSQLEGWNANPRTISVWQGSNLTIDGVSVPPNP